MITERTARARARKGAKFLDKTIGRGWRRKIKLSRLDQSVAILKRSDPKACGCIVAQLYGAYGYGTHQLGLYDSVEETKLGLLASETGDYPRLTEAWKQEIRESR